MRSRIESALHCVPSGNELAIEGGAGLWVTRDRYTWCLHIQDMPRVKQIMDLQKLRRTQNTSNGSTPKTFLLHLFFAAAFWAPKHTLFQYHSRAIVSHSTLPRQTFFENALATTLRIGLPYEINITLKHSTRSASHQNATSNTEQQPPPSLSSSLSTLISISRLSIAASLLP